MKLFSKKYYLAVILLSLQCFGYGCPDQIAKSTADSTADSTVNNNSSTQPITPSDLSGLKLWLISDTGVTKDGSNKVSAWADQSGTGNSVSQDTASSQPSWIDSVINQKPIIRFTGGSGLDDYLQYGGDVSAISTAFSVFLVIKFSANSYSYNPFYWGSPSTRYITNDNNVLKFLSQGGPTVPSSCPTLNSGSFIIMGITLNSSKSSVKFYLNGTACGSGDPSDTGSMVFFALGIGILPTTDASVSFDLTEVVFYNTELSDSDRQGVEAYLNSKYVIY
jgi:hypothetical protein